MDHRALALLLCVAIGSCGSAAKPPPKSALDIYAESAPALVMIAAGTHAGVGFVVDRNGLIAASLHTIQGQANIRVRVYDDTIDYPATVVAGLDITHDLVLLRIDAKKMLSTAPLGDSSTAAAGNHLYALSSGGPFDGVITTVRPLTPELTILTIKTSNPEQWQGPLFDERGVIVAIAAAFVSHGERLVIAVPANYLRSMIQHPISISPAAFASQTASLPTL